MCTIYSWLVDNTLYKLFAHWKEKKRKLNSFARVSPLVGTLPFRSFPLNERFCWSYVSWRIPLDGARVSGLGCRVCLLFRWQYDGPDVTPLTYHLNNSETTCSEIIFHTDFKSKEFCNKYFRSASEKKRKKRGNIVPAVSPLFQPNSERVI